jgi:hypothetical protein
MTPPHPIRKIKLQHGSHVISVLPSVFAAIVHAEETPGSDALGVNEDATLSGLVEFGEKNTLPLAQKHLTIHDGDSDRWLPGQELSDVSLSVDEFVFLKVFGAKIVIVVFVVRIGRDQNVDDPTKIIEKSCFRFIDQDRRCGVRRRDGDLPVGDVRTCCNISNNRCEIPELVHSPSVDVEGFSADRL